MWEILRVILEARDLSHVRFTLECLSKIVKFGAAENIKREEDKLINKR